MIKNITQSFMIDMEDYLNGEQCGNILQKRWVEDILIDLDSDAAELGCYFEYRLTLLLTGKGSLPKDGHVPEPGMYKNGKQMLEPYERCHRNIDRVKAYLDKMGLNVLEAGIKKQRDNFEGTIDLICECTKEIKFEDGSMWNIGDVIIIDLKYSALIDDKWNRLGWAGMLQSGPHVQKDHHGKQAIQYHFVSDEYPFYFLVTSSTNENDISLLHVPVTQEQIERHISHGNWLYKEFEFLAGIGFEARPSISRCNKCPIREGCADKHTFPHPKTVIL